MNISITYLEKIIHEMNSPLQNLGMIPELMLDDRIVLSKEDQKDMLRSIINAAEKLKNLTQMLSSITNLRAENIELNTTKADLAELIEREIKSYTSRIKQNRTKNLELVFNNKLAGREAKLDIDVFWFGQLLANLLVNAINHMENGAIEIVLEAIAKDGANYISLKVIDEGCGIPEDELESIFKPLERGSHSIGKVKGSGIGLAVAQEITQSHGGTISASNNASGRGARFEVVLPFTLQI